MLKSILCFAVVMAGAVSHAQINNPDNPNYFQGSTYTPEQKKAVAALPSNVSADPTRYFFVFDIRSGSCYAVDAEKNMYRVNDPLFKCDSNTQPRKEVLQLVKNPDLGNDKHYKGMVDDAKDPVHGYTVLECTIKKDEGDRCYVARVKNGHVDKAELGYGPKNQLISTYEHPDSVKIGKLEPLFKPVVTAPPAPVAPATKVTDKESEYKETAKIDGTVYKSTEAKFDGRTTMTSLPKDFGLEKDVAPTKPQLKTCRKFRKNQGHFVFHEDKNLYQDSNKAGNCPDETLSAEFQSTCLYKDYCAFEDSECTPERCVNYVRELRDSKRGYYDNVKEKEAELYKAQNNYTRTNKKFLECKPNETQAQFKKVEEAQAKVKTLRAEYAMALKTFNAEALDKLSKGGFKCVAKNLKNPYEALQYTQEANSYVNGCFQIRPELREQYLNKIGTIRSVDSVKEKH